MIGRLVLILLLWSCRPIEAQEIAIPRQVLESIRHLAIQHNGRLKPLDSFAREVITQVTGSPSLQGQDPVQTLLAIIIQPGRWQEEPLIVVPFVPLRDQLGLDRKATHVSYNDLVSARKLMRMLPPIVGKQQRDEKLSVLENEVMDVYDRFVVLSSLFEQKLHMVPPSPSLSDTAHFHGSVWLSILQPTGYSQQEQKGFQDAWEAFVKAVGEEQPQGIDRSATQLVQLLRTANATEYPAQWRLQLEVAYNQLGPFRIARFVYLAAFLWLVFGLGKGRGTASLAGMLFLVVGFLVHGMGILMRVIVGGRPPVSNFYETMLWLPFVGVGLSLIFERIYRVGTFGVASSLLAAIVLLLADHLPLDSSISPVVAVLRSNLWLTIHVLTIVASYGVLALATVLAHLYGVVVLLHRGEHPALEPIGKFVYHTIQIGVVLLASGIMLGAVWANASWGRYWGWDPKETWALITLLWFLAVLHGRFAGWLKDLGVALSTMGGFFLLLMTYYGVSFYLVGLHSYAGGHAKPLPTLLVSYLIAECVFIMAVGWVALSRQKM